jgi:hypothetical protein
MGNGSRARLCCLWANGEANNSGYPYQIWHYRHVAGENQGMTVRFVDTCQCGDFVRETDPLMKN